MAPEDRGRMADPLATPLLVHPLAPGEGRAARKSTITVSDMREYGQSDDPLASLPMRRVATLESGDSTARGVMMERQRKRMLSRGMPQEVESDSEPESIEEVVERSARRLSTMYTATSLLGSPGAHGAGGPPGGLERRNQDRIAAATVLEEQRRHRERQKLLNVLRYLKYPYWMAWAGSVVMLGLIFPLSSAAVDVPVVVVDAVIMLVYVLDGYAKKQLLGWGGLWRRKWMLLDIVITIGGTLWYLSLIPYFGDVLRTVFRVCGVVRILRPVMIHTGVKEIKLVAEAINHAAGSLTMVAILAFFFMLMAAVLAVQQWKGTFRYSCTPSGDPVFAVLRPARPDLEEYGCQNLTGVDWWSDFTTNFGAFICPWGYECTAGGNPGRGFESFDHTGFAMLQIVVSTGLESWPALAYRSFHTSSYLAFAYWVIVLLVGHYFLVNLILLTLAESYAQCLVKRHYIRQRKVQRRHARQPVIAAPGWRDKLGQKFESIASPLQRLKAAARPRAVRLWLTARTEARETQALIVLAVLANTVLLCVPPEFSEDGLRQWTVWQDMNVVLLIIFTTEMMVKLYALGGLYFTKRMNVLDCVINIAGWLKLFVDGPLLSVLDAAKVMRVFKLSAFIPQLSQWLYHLWLAIQDTLYLVAMIGLFVYTLAVVGYWSFEGKYCEVDVPAGGTCPPGDTPRESYNTIHKAFITTFIVLTGENWNEVMYNAMRSVGEASCIYFLLVFLIGHYVLSNMFAAILLSHNHMTEADENYVKEVVQYSSLNQRAQDDLREMNAEAVKVCLLAHGVDRDVITEMGRGMNGLAFAEADDCDIFRKVGVSSALWRARLVRESEKLRFDINLFKSGTTQHRIAATDLSNYFAVHRLPLPKRPLYLTFASYADDPALLHAVLSLKYPTHAEAFAHILHNWVLDEELDRKERHNVMYLLRDMYVGNETAPKEDIESMVSAHRDRPDLLSRLVESEFDVASSSLLLLKEWKSSAGLRDMVLTAKGSRKALPGVRGGSGNASGYRDKAWMLFGPNHPVRQVCRWAVGTLVFKALVVASVCVSSLTFAISSPLRPTDHPVERALQVCHLVAAIAFGAEVLLKSTAWGFLFNYDAYLRRSWWNAADFVVAAQAILSEIILARHPELRTPINYARFFRLIRPITLAHTLPGVRVVSTALIYAVRPLLNVILILLVIWLFFAIYGLQQFAECLYRCTTVGGAFGDRGHLSKVDCLARGHAWENSKVHFDTLPHAFETLFQIATLEGYIDIMHLTVDCERPRAAPREDARWYYAYYYVAFIIFGSMFVLNMFIGVLIEMYAKKKHDVGASLLLTPRQEEWVTAHREMMEFIRDEKRREIPEHFPPWRKRVAEVVHTPQFGWAVIVMVGVNAVAMACEKYPSTRGYDDALEAIDAVIVILFLIEFILKLLAMGTRKYFSSTWCRFDFIILVFSVVPFVLQWTFSVTSGLLGVLQTLFRSLRLLRLVKMAGTSTRMRLLLSTFLYSLPALFNALGVIVLIFYFYAVFGMLMLGKATWIDGLNRDANFTTFGHALLTLLRMATGPDWMLIKYDCEAGRADGCDPHFDGCIPAWRSQIYFTSFMFLGMFVLAQLFVAVLLDNFDAGTSFDPRYRKRLRRAWATFAQGHKLPLKALRAFLWEIGPPLGLCQNSPIADDFIAALKLRTYGSGDATYVVQGELYPKLFYAAFETDLPERREKQLLDRLRHYGVSDKDSLRPALSATYLYRVLPLQRIGRAYLLRMRLGMFRRLSIHAAAAYVKYETDDGVPYYHNPYTGDTVWVNPAAAVAIDQPEWEEQLRALVAAPSPAPQLDTSLPVADAQRGEKWLEFTDESGKAYYYDVNSGRTTWEMPHFYSFEV